MARAKFSRLSSRRSLAFAGALAVLHALLPASWTPWASWGRSTLEVLVRPAAALAAWSAAGLRSDPLPRISNDPRFDELHAEFERFKLSYQQRLSEIDELKRQVVALQGGLSISPAAPVVQFVAKVVGAGADRASSVFSVRIDNRKGITDHNAVAVVQGVHLVGRVKPTVARLCDVIPITDRGARGLTAVIMLDAATRGPTCSLDPIAGGLLRGDVQADDSAAPASQPQIFKGMTVRLSDSDWPSHASGLIVGIVESVGPKPGAPLRNQVTVKPQIDFSRLTEVIVRAAPDVTDDPSTQASEGKP